MQWDIHPASALAELQSQWNTLHAANNACPVLAFDFASALLETFGKGDEVVALCKSGGDPVAIGVFAPIRRGMWETFQPSQAPLGLWLQQPGHSTMECVRALFAHLRGTALITSVTQVDPDIIARPADSSHLQTRDYIDTARVTIDRDFESYWQTRGKNLQQNMRKQRRRLESEKIATALDIITDPAQVAAALHDYGQLEIAGWKAAEGTAVHPDNAQGTFYRRALESACARSAGCVFRYRFGDKPVAMELCLQSADVMVILKTTYDENIKGLSPATLMRQESFAHIFSRGNFKRIEFYGRVMDWHTKLTEEIRSLYHINVYRWRFLPRAMELANKWRGRPGIASAGQTTAANAAQSAA